MTTETKPGVSFNETMKGGFALGETDPKKGEQKGEAQGTYLAIHCDIDIPDSYAFIADPQHLAAMHGHVDFPPFGVNLPAPTGLFNLFSPGGNPKHKQMIYELGFEHDGQQYYVAGTKEVRDDPGLDMWDDITTCFTRLHQGTDKSGLVVGAGVIYIKKEQLLNLIPTIRATNTNSKEESLKVLADFGKFFMGSIWETHSKL
jgi:hypothetical protein